MANASTTLRFLAISPISEFSSRHTFIVSCTSCGLLKPTTVGNSSSFALRYAKPSAMFGKP